MSDPELTTDELIERMEDLSNGRATLQQKIRALETENKGLKEQLETAQKINRQQPVTQEQLEAAQAEVAALTTERDSLKTEVNDQSATIAQQQAEIATLRQEHDKLGQKHGALKAAAQKAINGPQADPEPDTAHTEGFLGNVMRRQNPGPSTALTPKQERKRGWGHRERSK